MSCTELRCLREWQGSGQSCGLLSMFSLLPFMHHHSVQDIKGKKMNFVFATDTKFLPIMYLHSVQDIKGKTVPLSEYKGKVVLVVNVASQW